MRAEQACLCAGKDFAPPDSNRTNNSVLLESFYRERQQQDSGISYHSELQAINSSVNKTRRLPEHACSTQPV